MLSKNQLLISILEEGTTSVSNLLLSNYQNIGLNDQEMMLIIHLLYFQSKGNFFPGVTELTKRMSLGAEELMKILQHLVKKGYIYIEEATDNDGKPSELYNLKPILVKVVNEIERNFEVEQLDQQKEEQEKSAANIFKAFEQEFGRPLSPMEIELINTWIDKDNYPEGIINYALKEAVFSNKLNFRYIDKILFDWQKKNIKTVEQVREYLKSFRNQQPSVTKPLPTKNTFEFYNWLENE